MLFNKLKFLGLYVKTRADRKKLETNNATKNNNPQQCAHACFPSK